MKSSLSVARNYSHFILRAQTNSLESMYTGSDVFYRKQLLGKDSRLRTDTPEVLNSTQLLGTQARETITISTVTSPEPPIVTLSSDSKELTVQHGYGRQQPIFYPSFIDLNQPINLF